MQNRRKLLSLLITSTGLLLSSQSSLAQSNLPKGPITLVVPFAAGGATDIVSRLVAKKVTEKTGVAIIVENVAGGGGVVGGWCCAAIVLRVAAEGAERCGVGVGGGGDDRLQGAQAVHLAGAGCGNGILRANGCSDGLNAVFH